MFRCHSHFVEKARQKVEVAVVNLSFWTRLTRCDEFIPCTCKEYLRRAVDGNRTKSLPRQYRDAGRIQFRSLRSEKRSFLYILAAIAIVLKRPQWNIEIEFAAFRAHALLPHDRVAAFWNWCACHDAKRFAKGHVPRKIISSTHFTDDLHDDRPLYRSTFRRCRCKRIAIKRRTVEGRIVQRSIDVFR